MSELHRVEFFLLMYRWAWVCSCGKELLDNDSFTAAESSAFDHE